MRTRMQGGGVAGWVLRVLVAGCLVTDAVVHLHLAGRYGQASAPGHLSEGLLFRVESVAALIVALVVLLLGSRIAFAAAFLVAGSAFVAVMLFRYVNVPAFGPIPSMYEPVWFAEKTNSAIAEGLGAALSLIGFAHGWISARSTSHTRPGRGRHTTAPGTS